MRATTLVPCLLVLAGAISAQSVSAQEIQDDVPIDLVKALLGSNSPFDVRIYSAVPDHFPQITIPDSAELLGGADMGHSQQIVMRVEGDGMRQRAQIIAALESEGYLMLTQMPAANPAQTGFVAPQLIPPSMPVQLCHDTHGMLSVRITGNNPAQMGSTQTISPGTQSLSLGIVSPFFSTQSGAAADSTATTSVINISSTGGAVRPRTAMMGGVSCEQMQLQFSGRGQGGPMMPNINQYMPRMELPAAATLPGMGMRPAMFSGSAGGMESRIDMSIDWDLPRLFRHFTDQIAQQNWQIDNETVGSISANAGWTREVDDMKLLGSLRVVNTADSHYQLQFSVQNLSAQ